MTKEASRIINTYKVRVDYRAGGREQTSTAFTIEAGGRVEAQQTGRRRFEKWVAYNREHGHGDLTDLEILRVRCTFVGSRTV